MTKGLEIANEFPHCNEPVFLAGSNAVRLCGDCRANLAVAIDAAIAEAVRAEQATDENCLNAVVAIELAVAHMRESCADIADSMWLRAPEKIGDAIRARGGE